MPRRAGVVGRQLGPLGAARGSAATGECSVSRPAHSDGRRRRSAVAVGQLGRRLELGVGQLGGGQPAGGVAVLPAHALAADLLEREPAVEAARPSASSAVDRRRGDGTSRPAPQPLRRAPRARPHRPHLAGMADRLAHALEAAVGVGDRALLLGVGLGGEHHVGVLARAPSVRKSANATTAPALSSARPQRALGGSAIGSHARAAGSPVAAGRPPSARRPSRVRQARGPGPAAQPTSRRPRPLCRRGHLDQPDSGCRERRARRPAPAARRAPARRARRARRRSPQSDHHVARLRSSAGRRARRASASRARRRRAPGRPRSLRGERAPSRARASAASAGARARSARAAGRVRVERARAGSSGVTDLRAVAAHRLAHAQVEDRRLVHQLGVDHEHRAGVVDVRHARATRSGRASTRACSGSSAPPARESTCGEPSPSRIRCWSEEALLVRGLAARQRGGRSRRPSQSAAAASASARSHDTSRSAPPSRTSGAVMRSGEWIAW